MLYEPGSWPFDISSAIVYSLCMGDYIRMKYGISTTPHRDVVSRLKTAIRKGRELHTVPISDIAKIDAAHEAHIRAKVEFSTSNSDYTMVNLIGTWARLNRVMMEMEEKYAIRA